MSSISGQGTTFNLPNYQGRLLQLNPTDTPFTTAIGGLNGGKTISATEWEWQGRSIRKPGHNRQRVEGDTAPAGVGRKRQNFSNVVEIHQEAVEVSYSKQAATGNLAADSARVAQDGNPVQDELSEQIDLELAAMKQDIEVSFLTGEYNKPADNTGKRSTRGLIPAIELGVAIDGTTKRNVVDKAAGARETATVTISNNRFAKASHGLADGAPVRVIGGESLGFDPHEVYFVVGQAAGYFSLAATAGGVAITPLADGTADYIPLGTASADDLKQAMQLAWVNGGFRNQETATLQVGADAKVWLTDEFINRAGYVEQTRNVGGVSCTTVQTDFGVLNVMLNALLPRWATVPTSLDQCQPVFMPIDGKGTVFAEPLAKVGASEKYQLYTETGLEYGSPISHALLKNVYFGATA